MQTVGHQSDPWWKFFFMVSQLAPPLDRWLRCAYNTTFSDLREARSHSPNDRDAEVSPPP